MRRWRIVCGAAVLALGLTAAGAHADEWNKLTYLTFSAPVTLPGVTLPAGTYRFELMDPDSSRRVIRVSEKDGSKQYGIFLSISDQKLEPSDNPVVMFRETPSGSPQAVRAWFYPGETYGYEFVYPHDQAERIAKATHDSVLAMNEPASSTTDEDRVASMRGAEVGRIDENGKPLSTDEHLKDSSTQRPATTTSSASTSTTAPGSTSTTTSSSTAATGGTAASNTAASNTAASNTAASNTAANNTAASNTTRSARAQSNTAASSTANDQAAGSRAVGTSGSAGARRLPRTASPVPFLALLSVLSIGSAAGVRIVRKTLA